MDRKLAEWHVDSLAVKLSKLYYEPLDYTAGLDCMDFFRGKEYVYLYFWMGADKISSMKLVPGSAEWCKLDARFELILASDCPETGFANFITELIIDRLD